MKQSKFFHVHCHSHYSALDGMSDVAAMVAKAAKMGQPGMALTDHGNGAGWVAHYKACKAHDIKPFPGVEGYLIDPQFDGDLDDSGKAGRFHLGLLALSEKGYKGLVEFVSMTHTRPRFNRFPRFTLSDLAGFGQDYGKHIALTTGCYFGLVQQTLINEGPDAAERIIKMYAEWFPHTIVEVQNHNITDENNDLWDDKSITKALMRSADRLGLPVVATQDSHYLDSKHKTAHALMKRMVYGGVEDEFPGDSFHLASGDWVAEHYKPKQWAKFEEGYAYLLDHNKVRIKPLDTFKVDVPGDWKNPDKVLTKKVLRAHEQYMKNMGFKPSKVRIYEDHMTEELSVIKDLGMPGYFLIWDDFIRWCKRQHICVEARGSGNGSYVNFLLGITQVDPIIWDGMFERFLSRDRIKAPDIDLDIEDSRRGEAIDYLTDKYVACQIGTWGQLGITVDKETGEERGSVFATWQQGKRRQCEAEAIAEEQARCEEEGERFVKYRAVDAGKARFAKEFGWMKSIEDVKRAGYKKDYRGLKQINEMKSVYRSYGVHAGGVLLSGNRVSIPDYIPTMLVASSDTTVSQFDMDAVEEFGLLKMDILGQTSLSVMRRCQDLMGLDDPTDFSWIPLKDSKALALLRTGKTDTGIFHFEGYTKSKGGRELGVKSVHDAILVQALYMPGCMDVAPGHTISQKDLYLQRRKDKYERDNVEYIHPVFEKVLSPTYGCVVYQEQVIAIMRELGMSIASVNKFFKVVKDSGKGAVERNKGRLEEVRKEFDDLCAKNDIDPDEAWMQTASFVAYGFNKNHATGYGIRSYRTAYLKAHYPLEYMTALLQSWAGRDKEKVYLREARKMEIPILPPDINNPSHTWAMDKRRGGIRRGLVSIAGIGAKVAEEISSKAPFTDMDDFCQRVNGRIVTGAKAWRDGEHDAALQTGVLKKLNDAGVLSRLKS